MAAAAGLGEVCAEPIEARSGPAVLGEVVLRNATTRSVGSVLEWSVDGQIAVATTQGVCIVRLAPSMPSFCSEGPNHCVQTVNPRKGLDERIRDGTLTFLPPQSEVALRQFWALTEYALRCLAWSPPVLSQRCLLATICAVTGKVIVWMPDTLNPLSCVWIEFAVLIYGKAEPLDETQAAKERATLSAKRKKKDSSDVSKESEHSPESSALPLARCLAWCDSVFADDSVRLATGHADGTLLIWRITESHQYKIVARREAIKKNLPLTSLAWCRQQFLLLGFADGELISLDPATCNTVAVLRHPDSRPLTVLRISPERESYRNHSAWCVWAASARVELCRLNTISGLPIVDSFTSIDRSGPGLRNIVSLNFLQLSTLNTHSRKDFIATSDADGALELWHVPTLSTPEHGRILRANWRASTSAKPPVPHAWALTVSPNGATGCFLQHVRFDTVKRNDAHSKLRFTALLLDDAFQLSTLESISRYKHRKNNEDWLWLRLQARIDRLATIDRDSIVGNSDASFDQICSKFDSVISQIASNPAACDTTLLHIAHALAASRQHVWAIRNELARRCPSGSSEDNEDDRCPICDASLSDTKAVRRLKGRVQCLHGHSLLTSSCTGSLIPLLSPRFLCPACSLSIGPDDDPYHLCPFCHIFCCEA